VLVSNDEWHTLAEPRDSRTKFTESFQKDANLSAAGGLKDMTPGQRAMLLALLLCSTKDNFDKGMAKTGGRMPTYNPPISEENSRSFRVRNGKGWDEVVDGWGNPIAYEIDIASASAGGAPKFVLMSAGEDGDFSTTSDNIRWSKDRGFNEP
jgi:hypothetical protein